MLFRYFRATKQARIAIAVFACVFASALGVSSYAQSTAAQPYGIAAKHPVLQAACSHCPWGALGDAVKKIMASYGYDVAVCYTCFGVNSVRIVSKRLVGPEPTARNRLEGIAARPDAPADFGITQAERVRWAYEGSGPYQKDGPYKNLRIIAEIESPNYFMVAVTKASGITDLKQIRDKKMPVRVLAGTGTEPIKMLLDYYGISKADIESWGGKFLDGNALEKDSNFDVIIGEGVLANNPEGNMWYEMSQKKDLVFLPLDEDLRRKMAAENKAQLVDLPIRYMRGVGDSPLPTIAFSGTAVYGRDDLPDQFVYDVAKALDEKHGLIKWTSQPFSYDPATVWDGLGVPLHPAAARYYRERGYTK